MGHGQTNFKARQIHSKKTESTREASLHQFTERRIEVKQRPFKLWLRYHLKTGEYHQNKATVRMWL